MGTRFQHLLPALRRLAASATPVGLETVGRDANLSPGRAQRVFRDIIGESPKQYQQRVRLQRSAALLAGSEARIIDIAVAAGFESHEAFTRAFRRRFGATPRDYRRAAAAQSWRDPDAVRLVARTAPCISLYRRPVQDRGGTTRSKTRPKENQHPMDQPEYEIEQQELEATPVLFGTRKLDKEKVADGLAEVLPAAFGYAMSEGLAMAGPPFVRYIEQSPAFTTVEAGVPLAEAAPAPPSESGISAGELPGGPAAVTVHKGPYDTLADAHVALDRWMADQGLSPAGPPWEVYLTDPAEVPDPADWLTQVVWPTQSG